MGSAPASPGDSSTSWSSAVRINSGVPVQGTFLQDIKIGYAKDCDKAGHGEECHCVCENEFLELHRPWVHEDNFDIKDYEKHGDEVELHTEAGSSIAYRKHAAFVRDIFNPGPTADFPENHTGDQH